MNRNEVITMLQLSRGLKIAECRILSSVDVSYEDIVNNKRNITRTFQPDGEEYYKPYHYKVPPGLNLQVGDLVALPAQNGLVFGRVRKLHDKNSTHLNLQDSRFLMRWVMAKIDPALHDAMVIEEADIARQLQAAQLQRHLRDLEKDLGYDLSNIQTPNLIGAYHAKTPEPRRPDAESADRPQPAHDQQCEPESEPVAGYDT